MLTVEDYEKIRKAVLVEGLSERKAAKKFGHSRKTVKKALQHVLLRQCVEALSEVVEEKDRTRGELLDEEREFFLPLPMRKYEACIVRSTYATKQSPVEHDGNFYSVPVKWAHHEIIIKAFVGRIELHHDDELIAEHKRNCEKSQYVLDYLHFLPLLRTKPGGIHNAAAFIGQPWGNDFEKMRTELEYRYSGEGTRKFVNILLLFCDYEASQVKAAVKTCVLQRAFNDEAVVNVLQYQPDAIRKSIDISNRPDLLVKTTGIRNANEYDRMFLRERSVGYGRQHIA